MEETMPIVDGLRLLERTDEAGAGEVWTARFVGGLAGPDGQPLPGELAGVGECFVRVLRLPVEEAIRARAHVIADELVGLTDPGIVGVREVRSSYDGVALVLAPLPTPMLALSLLARRRQLRAGEIVTLGVALSWALAAAHCAGFTHGRLRDADVLIDPAGRPLLAGVGIMGVLGSAGEAAADVRALGRMLLSLLDADSAGASGVSDTLRELSGNANELAAALAQAAPAEPIALHDDAAAAPVRPPAKRSHRRRLGLGGLRSGAFGALASFRLPRLVRLAAAGAAVLVLAGVIGWVSAPGPSSGNEQVAAISHPATDWSAVLTSLDAARARAFAEPGTVLLDSFDAPGSTAYRYDAAAVAALQQQGGHAQGLRMVLTKVAVNSQSYGEVTLLVTDRRTAYQVLDSAGQVLTRTPARASAQHVIVLRAGGASKAWRVAEVRDAL